MFKGKFSIIKDIIYFILLGLHSTIFANFLFSAFIKSKSCYFYFYIGIIISSVPIIPVVYLSALLIIPEISILTILLWYGLDRASDYYKMRVDKKANVMQHDPAVTHFHSAVYPPIAFRMDEVWNPDSSIPLKNEDKTIETKMLNLKVQLFSFLLTIGCLVLSIISVYLYLEEIYLHFFNSRK